VSASMVLALALRAHAASAPDSTAVVEPGRTWSYGALDAHADAQAAGLVAADVVPGDRLVLLATPSASAIALLAAAGRIGACVAPLGTTLTAPELAAAGVVIGPRLAVHDAEHVEGARALGVATVLLETLGAGFAKPRSVSTWRRRPSPS
jgi:acyl-CoA synthetase (AMP-forming)/AMP-acid ligase II